jgi:DNA (cytosine-5)-methyltransferase 1
MKLSFFMNDRKISVLDLFSWCWWLTEWFFQEPYMFVWHIEMNPSACETLKSRIVSKFLQKNNLLDEEKDFLYWKIERQKIIEKYWLQKDINMVYNKEISDDTYQKLLEQIKENLKWQSLDIIIWWPPCQTYSQIWRARIWKKIEKDPRNFLYKQYVKFLRDLSPKIFVFENVPGLRTAWSWKYFQDIKNAMDDIWYEIQVKEQYMPDYWIPQNRRRLIIIWWKKGNNVISTYPDFSKYKKNYTYIVNDFLKDLPKIQNWWWKELMKYQSENEILEKLWIRKKMFEFVLDHRTRPIRKLDREIYKIAVKKYNRWEKLQYRDLPENLITHKNVESFQNRFNVVAWKDKITSTIVAHISSDGHYYIHPDIKQNRSLSIREAARIQTFPDDFKFEWSRTSIFKQIGNAVPPMFSNILAKELVTYFK